MLFNYKYSGTTTMTSDAKSVGMSFAPDTLREPTYFIGELNKKIPFREAMSALHDVVVSDLRFRPKDREEYKEWLSRQEDIWYAEALAQRVDNRARIEVLQKELSAVRNEKYQKMQPFYDKRREYYQYLYKRHIDLWYVLDPVITVHPDELFFECFSQDESSYGKLSCDYNVFTNINEFECGTTNIDYSAALYNEFQKIRNYKTTDFKVDPSGFEVQTTDEQSYKEVKIDLPDSWVRGFLQVSSAMTLPATTFELHPQDIANFLFLLKRFKEKEGPRSMRFYLTPGQPVKVIFEPWNYEVVCSRSIFKGNDAREIRLWGRRRLLILERLLPITKKLTVTLLGTGLPSFYVADLGDMAFTLGLSGWTANDWSRAGNFDLMAPRAEVDGMTQQKVYTGLREKWFEDGDALSRRLGLDRQQVLGALSAFTQAGRVIYDLNKNVYRIRELSREALPMDKLRFANEREQLANQIVARNRITELEVSHRDGNTTIAAKVDKYYAASLTIDRDERIVEGKCSCSFFHKNKLYKGPCEHILAARIAARDKMSAGAVRLN